MCEAADLPAFPDEKALRDFLSTHAPRVVVHHAWQCRECDHWHAQTSGPAPGGESSGTDRNKKKTVPRSRLAL